MSKKRKIEFMIDDEVTFKNDFELQMFGFFYVNDIIYYKGQIKYQLYKISDNKKELVPGSYSGNQLQLVSKETDIIHKKKKLKSKRKVKSKKSKKKILPYLDLLIGYEIDGTFELIRTKQFQSIKQAWKMILKLFPNASFKCAQLIDYADPNYENENCEFCYSYFY